LHVAGPCPDLPVLRRATLKFAALCLAALALLWACPAAAQVGASCTGTGNVAGVDSFIPFGAYNTTDTIETPLFCSTTSGDWVGAPLQLGSTSTGCSSTTAGTVQYTGGTFEGCNGTSWVKFPGLQLISTQTASNSATLQWTGLGSSYNTMFLDCNDVTPGNSGYNFEVQVGESAGPTWETSNYYDGFIYIEHASATVEGVNNSDGGAVIVATSVGSTGIASDYNLSLKLWISNMASTTAAKQMELSTSYDNGSSQVVPAQGGGAYYGDANAVTALRVLFSTGNISSGQCSLYGLNY
jgi:hypothetical protein